VDECGLYNRFMQTLRTIVVGTDFSECAEHALDTAITLASLGDARVAVVHVCALSAERGVAEALVSQALDDQLLDACQAALDQVIARHSRRGVELTGVLRNGRPAEKLSNVAAEVGASVIVIGRHGAGRAAQADLGTVSDRLMRTSTRPVLIVPCNLARSLGLEVP
jgi:nucleotide-binding universal stress UspA family protein